jgi:hypothetical protein
MAQHTQINKHNTVHKQNKEQLGGVAQVVECLPSKECKSAYNRDTCTPMFIAALFAIAKLWNQPRYPSVDE